MEQKNVQITGIDQKTTEELLSGNYSFVGDKLFYKIYFTTSEDVDLKWIEEFHNIKGSSMNYSIANLNSFGEGNKLYIYSMSNIDKLTSDLPVIQEIIRNANSSYNTIISGEIEELIQSELNKIKYFNVNV